MIILIVFGWSSHIGKPRTQVLPSPNGYPILLKAGLSIISNPDGSIPTNHEVLKALVATNSQALQLLRVGLSYQCAVDTDALLANSLANDFSEIMTIKSLSPALLNEGLLAEMENRSADAARSYLDAIRLGNQMSHGGFIFSRLTGIAGERIGFNQLVKLLPKLDCLQLTPIIADLERVDQNTVDWDEVLENENRFLRSQLGSSFEAWKVIPELWLSRGVRRRTEQRHLLGVARLRLLIIELALRAYRCDQGQSPTSLISLVPKYLHSLPKDPFSGRTIAYRASGTNWVLYSVGPDGVDDGGKPVGKLSSGNNRLGSGSNDVGLEQNKVVS